jgi:putative endonuclease
MHRERQPAVSILANRRHGTLYVGVTSDPPKRIHDHREGLIPGFTRRYGIKRLVHFEMFEAMGEAIGREKRLKDWRRAWKIELIESRNEHWDDLATTLGFARLPD